MNILITQVSKYGSMCWIKCLKRISDMQLCLYGIDIYPKGYCAGSQLVDFYVQISADLNSQQYLDYLENMCNNQKIDLLLQKRTLPGDWCAAYEVGVNIARKRLISIGFYDLNNAHQSCLTSTSENCIMNDIWFRERVDTNLSPACFLLSVISSQFHCMRIRFRTESRTPALYIHWNHLQNLQSYT